MLIISDSSKLWICIVIGFFTALIAGIWAQQLWPPVVFFVYSCAAGMFGVAADSRKTKFLAALFSGFFCFFISGIMGSILGAWLFGSGLVVYSVIMLWREKVPPAKIPFQTIKV